jgi:hypothetical protein
MSTLTKPSKSAGLFVSAAPDAKPCDPTARSSNWQRISIAISPGIARRPDEPADQAGQTRAGLLPGGGI